MPRLTKAAHAQMMADYAAGMKVNSIAEKYGVHPTAAGKAVKRAGLATRQQPALKPSRRSKRAWQASNPEKRRAHKAVERALADGSLSRKACERCGDEKSQAHHEDYSKQLDVIWLCQLHHKQRHTEMKKAAEG